MKDWVLIFQTMDWTVERENERVVYEFSGTTGIKNVVKSRRTTSGKIISAKVKNCKIL